MYTIVALLVFCYHVSLSQPVTYKSTTRLTRQLPECCPCPSTGNGGPDVVGQFVRASDLDDCPCRPRGADSEGASSVFFPSTALHSVGAPLRPVDPKEDPKNLLEPEVTLATSMLDTLREATEEEYRDALDREAARSAAEPDPIPEESARNVVIVINPRDSDNDDDFISEASHVQESRCIHPLGSTTLSKMRSSPKTNKLFPDTLEFPKWKHHNLLHNNLLHLDSNSAASNVDESFIDVNPNFQTRTPTFQVNTPINSLIENNDEDDSYKKASLKFDGLDENSSNLHKDLKFSLLPNLKLNKNLLSTDDYSPATSTEHEQSDNSKTSQLFKQAKLPLHLRNLLKLRDIELIPKSIRNKPLGKPKLDMTQFAIPTHLNRNHKENHSNENCNEDSQNLESILNDVNTKIVPVKTSERFVQPNTHAHPQSNVNLNVFENEIMESKKENLDNLPSLIDQKDTAVTVSAEDLTNMSECDILESKNVLHPTDIIQHEDTQYELNKIVSNSNTLEPLPTTILMEETDTGNNRINFDVEDTSNRQELNTDEDSETDSSDNNFISMPSEIQERKHNVPSQNQENHENVESSVGSHNLKEIIPPNLNEKRITSIEDKSPLGKTLSNMRESVIRKLENLKKPVKSAPTKVSDDNNNISVENEPNQNIGKVSANTYLNSHEIQLNDIGKSESKEIEKDVSMKDLQHMSDKLLASQKSSGSADCGLDSTLVASNLDESYVDLDPNYGNFKRSEQDRESEIELSENKSDLRNKERNDADETNPKHKEDACIIPQPPDLDDKNTHGSKEEQLKSAHQNLEQKEMDTGASESAVNTIGILDSFNSNLKLKPPLLEDIAAKPLGDPLNLLGKPLADVLKINTNLPTLDNLRERLANIFKINTKSAEEDSSSIENESTNESPIEAMTSEASTIKFRQKLPSLQQLDDFNVETFQNKPIKSPSVDALSRIPKLNLNSYRAKIPIPNTLDIKQSKSKFANGARINRPLPIFELDRTSAHKFNAKNPLRNLESLPTLDELRKNLRSNTKSLLDHSVDPDLNLFAENLPSNDLEAIAETIRLNTQKTMKNIQHKMKSTLKQTKLNSPVSDSLGNPQELLDDMNDKLKAIHYDLNDRIASIHENIKAQTLNTANRNVMTNLRQNKIKTHPARLQSEASTVTTQVISPNRHTAMPKDLGTKAINHVNTIWDAAQNIQTTPDTSSSTPSVIKMPKLANPSLNYLQQSRRSWISPNLKREPTNLDDTTPIFRTSVNPFNDARQPNKVTISFGTTTARPMFPLRSNITPKMPSRLYEDHDSNKYGIRTEKKNSELNHRLQSVGNARLSTIKFKPLESFSTDEEFDETTENISLERNFSPNLDTFASKSLVKPSHSSLGDENSFLSKMKDAVNMRASKFESKSNNRGIKMDQSDMVRSPEKNTDIALDEPLKENVSYRCRMVCTKE